MAEWKVTPNWKKSVIERQEWFKDGNRLVVETGWRWGEFTVYTEDDTPPSLEPGVDIYDCGYETELVECSDGCWEEHDFDDCDEETTEWLEEFLEDNSYFDLEEHGWSNGDTEMIIDCEMTIERIDSDEEVVEESEAKEMLEEPAKWPFTRPHEGPKEEE